MKIFYWKNISWLQFFTFNTFAGDKKAIAIPETIFKEDWVELPVSFDEDKYNGNDIWGIMNSDEENPMATPDNQSWIKANGLHHTSMSVGDILKSEKGEMWVCVSVGWRKLILC